MKNYRFINYLQEKKSYWRAKHSLNEFADQRATSSNNTKSSANEKKIQFEIFRHSLKGMPFQLLTAILFIIIIELGSSAIQPLFNFSLTISQANTDTLVQLLTALVTVLGVVLGLYFTALSAVAGNLFVRAPSSLQRLFLYDRKGRQYIQILVLATLIGIFYLLCMSTGYQPSVIGPSLLVIICAYVVMRFMTLGSQAFYFIHPKEASSKLYSDIHRAISASRVKKHNSQRKVVQIANQQAAAQALHTFDKLVDFGIDPVKLSGQQLASIAEYIATSTQYYLTSRNQIPTDSAWFATKSQHQKWLISEDSNLIVALNTGTNLRPSSISYAEWYEESSLRIILKVLKHLIDIKDWSSAQSCLEVIVVLAQNSGRLMLKESTKIIVDKTIEVVSEALKDNSKYTDADEEGMLSLYEGIGRLPTAALLGLLKDIHGLEVNKLVLKLETIKWDKPGDIYKHNLPAAIIPELEKVQQYLNNERSIEGKPISPKWYLRTLALRHYLSAAKLYYEYLKSYETTYKKYYDDLTGANKYLPAACLTSCSLEFSNKLISLGQEVGRLLEESKELHDVEDLKWAEIDLVSEKAVVNKIYEDAIDRMTALIAPLMVVPKDKRISLPDYLGQAIVFGMNAVYEAAQSNDAHRLKQVFPSVLIGALGIRDAIREEVEGWLLESQIILISEPFEDILSLSGFIKIYSELHDNEELWKACEDTWNLFLSGPGVDAAQTIRMLAAAMSYRDTDYTISPRAGLRTNWDMRLRETLVQKGVSTEMNPNPFGTEDDEPTHQSPLIRIVARGASILSFDARTIFLTLFLSNHSSVQALNVDFPDRRDFEQMYDNEVNRHSHVEAGNE